MIKRICITSGDRDGVGLEVTRKALNAIGPQKKARFLIACSDDHVSQRELAKLRGFQKVVVNGDEVPLRDACKALADLSAREILIWKSPVTSTHNEASWVADAARAALAKEIDAIVTGPVSKQTFKDVNPKHMGHTGLLADLANTKIRQGYVGHQLCIVLATDHIALDQVPGTLDSSRIEAAIAQAFELRKQLPKTIAKRPVAVLGLNPHAGEDGLIGRFEGDVLKPVLSKFKKGDLIGPLAPDTAFSEAMRKTYSVVVALYHDQGLIPFKLLHGQDSGYQISMGLPFLRTSVDHGTANALFGKNKANPGSMISAIQGAIQGA